MLLFEPFTTFWPFPVSKDRGKSLEYAWHDNTLTASGTSLFDSNLGSFANKERSAEIPSLLFSPMLIEDARRLLISNLDVSRLCETTGPGGGVASRGAIDFFGVFPEAINSFTIATAARMNASFPFLSPAVYLPTDPPRRVVDAGYYDNFGVDVAAEWVYHHRQEIVEHTSGVLVLEVRAYANQQEPPAGPSGEKRRRLGLAPQSTQRRTHNARTVTVVSQ